MVFRHEGARAYESRWSDPYDHDHKRQDHRGRYRGHHAAAAHAARAGDDATRRQSVLKGRRQVAAGAQRWAVSGQKEWKADGILGCHQPHPVASARDGRVPHSAFKRLWGFTKVRRRVLAKNTSRDFARDALANLYRLRHRLVPQGTKYRCERRSRPISAKFALGRG